MAHTKLRQADAVVLLRKDHEELRDLFSGYHELGDPPTPSKLELFDLIRRLLLSHVAIEEEIFYPAVEHGLDPRARRLVAEARQEHRILRTLMSEILSLTPDDEAFDPKMAVLRETCEQHAAREEDKMAPIFRSLPRRVQ